jgi:hypothetical protein
VKKQSFSFEIQDLLIQFLAAFNNVVINRYNDRTREEGQKIQVRYVYAPKQRVLYDLVNPGQNLILPVVAITIGSISRDTNRVFSKNSGLLSPSTRTGNLLTETPFFRTPVPINISINMSVLAKNQLDMDQILGNFIPYNNPYIIIAWKVPEKFVGYTQEIRTEVLWDGNISINYPVEVNNAQKAQIVAETTFTIKGWLFPFVEESKVKNIYTVNADFYATKTGTVLEYTNYFNLSSLGVDVNEEQEITYSNNITIEGTPKFTNIISNTENS